MVTDALKRARQTADEWQNAKAICEADYVWRATISSERDARRRRDAEIRAAHDAGIGYGTIASWLGVARSTIQSVCATKDVDSR